MTSQERKTTYVVATLPDDAPTIYRVIHDTGLDVEAAVRRAVATYLRTPEGEAYLASINGDSFNWGDASAELPLEFLTAEGIHEWEQIDDAVLVDHDEDLGEDSCDGARFL